MIRFLAAMALGGALVALLLHYGGPSAEAQQGPEILMGCIYQASPPTLTNKQGNVLLCDSSGKLLTN